MFKINADMANHCLEVDFIGSYADIDQADFARQMRVEALRVKGTSDRFDMLVDFSRVPIMPQDRTEGARAEIEWCIANGLRRSANVVGSTLSKMQLERLSADDRFKHFNSRDEALAWLRSPD